MHWANICYIINVFRSYLFLWFFHLYVGFPSDVWIFFTFPPFINCFCISNLALRPWSFFFLCILSFILVKRLNFSTSLVALSYPSASSTLLIIGDKLILPSPDLPPNCCSRSLFSLLYNNEASVSKYFTGSIKKMQVDMVYPVINFDFSRYLTRDFDNCGKGAAALPTTSNSYDLRGS